MHHLSKHQKLGLLTWILLFSLALYTGCKTVPNLLGTAFPDKLTIHLKDSSDHVYQTMVLHGSVRRQTQSFVVVETKSRVYRLRARKIEVTND